MYNLDLKVLLLPKLLELLRRYEGIFEAIWSWASMQLNKYLHLRSLLLWPTILAQLSLLTEQLQATQLLGSHFGVPGIPATYDYVIVGGGTAGLVMARRLAANSSFTVAVVEAGGFYEFDNGNFSEIPAFAAQFTRECHRRLPSGLRCGCCTLIVSTYRAVCWTSEEPSDRLVSVH